MTDSRTAKERYTQYFREELEAHPDVPPNRVRIAERMGWKSSNHGGQMPQIRRELLLEAGFVLIGNRWRKGTFIEELYGFKVGQRAYRAGAYAQHGEVTSIAVAGERYQFAVTWRYDDDKTFAQPVNRDELASLVLPDDLSTETVERWLGDA